MRGATIAELALGLAITGILVAMGVPRAVALADHLAVERQAGLLLTAYHRARLVALTRNRLIRLTVTADRIAIYTLEAGDSTLAWQVPGPATDDVALVSAPAPAVFAPSGITMGVANGRYVLSKGDVTRTLVASRLGRLRVARP